MYTIVDNEHIAFQNKFLALSYYVKSFTKLAEFGKKNVRAMRFLAKFDFSYRDLSLNLLMLILQFSQQNRLIHRSLK